MIIGYKNFHMLIISFTKVDLPYGWLGNMSPFEIEYLGIMWKTAEALFQALRFHDDDIREIIRSQKSPIAAKMKAKANKDKYSVEPMSDDDLNNMRLCLRLKFGQHKILKEKLIKTGEHIIIEDIGRRRGSRHEFWGAYRNSENQWIGQNKLGLLLMELRSQYLTI